MNLTFFKMFHTIVQEGSFVKAAELLHMTPSAVSHAVSDAEAEIGFTLFNRNRNGVSMTEYAKTIYPLVIQMINGEESLQQTIDQLNGLERGVAKIGIFNSTCTNWMPEILERFKNEYPGIDVDIYEGGYDDVIKWIKDGTVDFGFLSSSCTTELYVEPLYKDPLICIVPPGFKTKTPGCITIDEMKDQSYVIQSAGSDSDVQVLIQKYGLKFKSNCHVLDDTSIMAMVACGRGISVMPTLTAKGLENGLQVLKIIPDEFRMIGLSALNKETLSPAAKALYDSICYYVRTVINNENVL